MSAEGKEDKTLKDQQEKFVNNVLYGVEELFRDREIIADSFIASRPEQQKREVENRVIKKIDNQMEKSLITKEEGEARKILATGFINSIENVATLKTSFQINNGTNPFRKAVDYPKPQIKNIDDSFKLHPVPSDKIPEVFQKIQTAFQDRGMSSTFDLAFSTFTGQTPYKELPALEEPTPEKPTWNKGAVLKSSLVTLAAWGIGAGIDGKNDFAFLKGDIFNSLSGGAIALIVVSAVNILVTVYLARPKHDTQVAPEESSENNNHSNLCNDNSNM